MDRTLEQADIMNWTAAKDDYLREGFKAGLSAAQIAEQMKLSRNAVCGRKFRLGIRGISGRPYTDDEIAMLRQMYAARRPAMEIAGTLGRSEAAIYVKASYLGITRGYCR